MSGLDNLPDLPNVKSANFLQRVREMLQALAGRAGSTDTRVVTVRDLVDAGLATAAGMTPGTSSPVIASNNDLFQPAYVADLSTPPTPTGLTVTAGLTSLIIRTDAPAFTAGHGYLRTLVYGALNTGVTPTYTEGVTPLLTEFVGAVGTYPVNPKETWHIWVKWKSVDGVLSGIAGGTNGVSATSGQDVAGLLTALNTAITSSQLNATLGSRINLIDGADTMPGSVDARIKTETTARQTETTSLSQQISALTAGVAGAFDAHRMWYFDGSVEGWTAPGATSIVSSGGWLTITNSTTPAVAYSPGLLSTGGPAYPVVKARIKRLAGSGWRGELGFTGGDSEQGFTGGSLTIGNPNLAVGAVGVVEWDMSQTQWADAGVSQITLQLANVAADQFAIDWIGIGRNAPGASVASLTTEQQARVSGDQTNASSITTLQTTVGGHTTTLQQQSNSIDGLTAQYTVKVDANGYVSGFGLASTLKNATPYSAFAIRADSFSITSPTGPGVTPITPFTVLTTDTVEHGVTIPAGVYMDGAYVRNLNALVARIGTAMITDAQIDSLSAAKLTAGSIETGEYIQSTGYTAGSVGFRVSGLGSAEFNEVTVRGTVYATAGKIGGAEIGTNYVKSTNYAGGSLGWKLENDTGYLYANNAYLRGELNTGDFTGYAWPATGKTGAHLSSSGLLIGNYNDGRYFQVTASGNVYAPKFSIINGAATFSGALSAASGTFAGNLSAAGGTFAGALSAATGTFAGSLTAQTVTADNIVSNSLTVTGSAVHATDAYTSVYSDTGGVSVVVLGFAGSSTQESGSGNDLGTLKVNGVAVATGYGMLMHTILNPAAGTYTAEMLRTKIYDSSTTNAQVTIMFNKR